MQHHKTPYLYRLFEAIWYKNHPAKYPLIPLSWLFCYLAKRRKKKLIAHQYQSPLPVIVVGNIAIGGTGKTPFTLFLVEQLLRAGYKPGIISRGYGGKDNTKAQLVNAHSDTDKVGDEAVLMAMRSQVPVAVCQNRRLSIALLAKHCDIIVSDDGLQHYAMGRVIEIVLVDAKRQYGNGYCLPAGPLREKPERLKQVDFIIYNQAYLATNPTTEKIEAETDTPVIHDQKSPLRYHMQLNASTLKHLDSDTSLSIEQFIQQHPHAKLHALSGIGHPQRFFQTLKHIGIDTVETHSFPDHHPFSLEDFAFITPDDIVIITEKDAVKCKKLHLKALWYLPVQPIITNHQGKASSNAFINQLQQALTLSTSVK